MRRINSTGELLKMQKAIISMSLAVVVMLLSEPVTGRSIQNTENYLDEIIQIHTDKMLLINLLQQMTVSRPMDSHTQIVEDFGNINRPTKIIQVYTQQFSNRVPSVYVFCSSI